ncbi:MAG: TIGR02449 family protein [Gammaproteobacteria bacterium]|nr:TIGR02449 family protein [Gammaproteobacteria bacterium]
MSDLGVLEQRIDELIEAVRTLSTENRALRAQRQSLTAERAKLLERNERASSQVDSMIGRLKALEEAS